jgi:hypothetical protein
MSIIIQQDVLWFQISVDDVEGVKVFKGTEQFGSIESRALFAESAFVL